MLLNMQIQPAEDEWGADLYMECAQRECPHAYDFFANTPEGVNITSNPLWSQNVEFVYQVMGFNPIARQVWNAHATGVVRY